MLTLFVNMSACAMNDSQDTEIAFVLDRSGSMDSCRNAAIAGFNRFLAEQQAAPGRARLTLALFNDQYHAPVSSLPVQEVVGLERKTYVPAGSTALLDAIGRTIDELGQRLSALPENNRPAQVIVAILTDGQENSSRRFTWQEVSDRIRHQSEIYRWTFLFLGANQDAIATAAQLSISPANAATYVADGAGSEAASAAFSRRLVAMRQQQQRDPVSDLTVPLSQLIAEEDASVRGKQS